MQPGSTLSCHTGELSSPVPSGLTGFFLQVINQGFRLSLNSSHTPGFRHLALEYFFFLASPPPPFFFPLFHLCVNLKSKEEPNIQGCAPPSASAKPFPQSLLPPRGQSPELHLSQVPRQQNAGMRKALAYFLITLFCKSACIYYAWCSDSSAHAPEKV